VLHFRPRLDGLRHCDPNLPQDGPSWIPNWSKPKKFQPLGEIYFASGNSRSEFCYKAPNILEVTGVRCATVRHVKSSIFGRLRKARGEPSISGRLREARGIMSRLIKSNTGAYVTGESVEDAVSATLCASITTERLGSKRGILPLEQWKNILLNNDPETPRQIALEVMDLTVQNAWLQTNEGYYGMGPSKARPGEHRDIWRK
jgi:hypothetical protein